MTLYQEQEGITHLPPGRRHQSEILKENKTIEDDDNEILPEQPGVKIASAEEVCEAIIEAYKRNSNFQVKLIKFAQRSIKRFIGGKYDGRLQPDDVVEEAVFRILNLDRKWYKNKTTKIENLILMAIVSLIKIEAKKIQDIYNPLYKPTESEETDEKNQDKKTRIIPLEYIKKDKSDINYQSNTVIDIEKLRYTDKQRLEDKFDFEALDEQAAITEIMDEFEEKDINAYFVLDEMLKGNRSQKSISKIYGLPINEVTNAYKRIKRRVEKLLNE